MDPVFPIIETKRLTIRPPRLGDEVPLNKAIQRSLVELKPWAIWAKNPELETTRRFVEKSVEHWQSENQNDFPMVLVLKNNSQLIGCSGFNALSKPDIPLYEPGYWLDTKYTGQGLMTEAVSALTRYAFDKLKANRVQLSIQAENTKSIAVAKRCGFQFEARLHNACLDIQSQKPSDICMFVRFE